MNEPRFGAYERRTKETEVKVALRLGGEGETKIRVGYGFLEHTLDLVFHWADIKAEVFCEGDLAIDAHHSVEDTGLAIGNALREIMGDGAGITRVGYGRVPMDEALAEATLDLSGRPWLEWRGDELLPPVIAGEEKDLWREFYKAICSAGRFNLHVAFLYGKNGHHLLESAAKGFGVALGAALAIRGGGVRSTKGGLD